MAKNPYADVIEEARREDYAAYEIADELENAGAKELDNNGVVYQAVGYQQIGEDEMYDFGGAPDELLNSISHVQRKLYIVRSSDGEMITFFTADKVKKIKKLDTEDPQLEITKRKGETLIIVS